jgi:hypothetical protein
LIKAQFPIVPEPLTVMAESGLVLLD